jgi:hypothetical protein
LHLLNQVIVDREAAAIDRHPLIQGMRDVAQINARLQDLARTNPQGAAHILSDLREARRGSEALAHQAMLMNAQFEQRQAAERQLAAQQEAESFKTFAAEHDAKYNAWEQTLPEPTRKMALEQLPDTLRSAGLSVEQVRRAIHTSTEYRHSGALQLMTKAALYDAMQRAPAKAAPKTLPPVQRPGVSQPRSVRGAESLSTLNSRLNASGNLDDAVKLLQAKRSARGR